MHTVYTRCPVALHSPTVSVEIEMRDENKKYFSFLIMCNNQNMSAVVLHSTRGYP